MDFGIFLPWYQLWVLVHPKRIFFIIILPTFFLLLTIQHAIHSFLPSRAFAWFSFLSAKEAGLKWWFYDLTNFGWYDEFLGARKIGEFCCNGFRELDHFWCAPFPLICDGCFLCWFVCLFVCFFLFFGCFFLPLFLCVFISSPFTTWAAEFDDWMEWALAGGSSSSSSSSWGSWERVCFGALVGGLGIHKFISTTEVG